MLKISIRPITKSKIKLSLKYNRFKNFRNYNTLKFKKKTNKIM